MSEEKDSHILKRYEIIKKIGKGAYGIVWKALDKKNKQYVALKFDAFLNSTDAQRYLKFYQELLVKSYFFNN